MTGASASVIGWAVAMSTAGLDNGAPRVKVLQVQTPRTVGASAAEERRYVRPWRRQKVDAFTRRISDFSEDKKRRMPANVKTYDGTGDPDDHLKIFESAATIENWPQPVWCHMFNSTLVGNARNWFSKLPRRSIDGFEELRRAFRLNFTQRKKCAKNPVELARVKQRQGESTSAYVERYKDECIHVKACPEILKISGFMNGINNPELIKRLNDRVPQTFDELMKRTRSFIQGEAAAADSRKGYSNNRSQEQSRRQSNDQSSSRNNSYRGQRGGRGNDKYTPLTMTPKEILATERFDFPNPPPMRTLEEQRHLRSPGEEHSGRKEFKDGGKKDALETRLAPIFMVAVMSSGKLSKMVKPLTIGDKCSGSRYHRMYIDGEHHADILSKHCFQRLRPEVKFMVGNKEHFYNSLMNFMVNQYPIAIQWHYWKTRDLSDTRGPIHGPWDAKVHPLQRRKLSPLQHRAPLKKCNSVTCDMTQETAATNDTPSKAENRASSERAKGHSGGGTLNNCGEYHARSLLPRLVIQPVMVKKKRMVAGDVHWDFTTLNNAMSQTVSTTGDRLEVGVLLRIPSKCFLDAYKGYPQIPIGQGDEE
ncbi:reverse transcriptase domain-containing protein [Tanacetum coccineum]